MTDHRARATEVAIVDTAVNVLTRRAEALRARAVTRDLQGALTLLRDADTLDEIAFGLFEFAPDAEERAG